MNSKQTNEPFETGLSEILTPTPLSQSPAPIRQAQGPRSGLPPDLKKPRPRKRWLVAVELLVRIVALGAVALLLLQFALRVAQR